MFSPQELIEKLANENKQLREALAAKGGAAGEAIPPEIQFATSFLYRHQDTTQPHACGDPDDPVIIQREAGGSETMAIGSACDLLSDYFDRHNQKLVRSNQAAARRTACGGYRPEDQAASG